MFFFWLILGIICFVGIALLVDYAKPPKKKDNTFSIRGNITITYDDGKPF